METPPCSVTTRPLISWPRNTSCSRIPPRAICISLPPRRWATTRCRLSLRPCTAPLSCSLQPLLNVSLLSLGPSLLQFVSIVSLLLNHGNPIFEPVCVFLPFPLLPLLFWLTWMSALSPCLHFDRYHHSESTLLLPCIVSWHYQRYWTILILLLCLLCETPLVCSSYSSFDPSSPFFSSWWQRDCKLFTHTLVLQCSPSTSSHQPQTTHVFADSRIALLCHALCICMCRQNLAFFPACTLSFSSLL